MEKKRVVSGIQPTGNIHLGNYLGAIKNWVNMQNEYDSFFFLADLHAITLDQNPEELRNEVYKQAASLIALGIDPSKSTLFIQSQVREHCELTWILGCTCPTGWLKRMTQFKDKSSKKDEVSSRWGLFSYPILMASDILLYEADLVPTGEDQKQHVELTRDLAESFNRKFQINCFKVPEPLITGSATRIKSLRDGTKKMSKSDPSDQSRINITDSEDEIIDKIKKAKTDSLDYISYEESRLEVSNLLEIFASITERNPDAIALEYRDLGFGKFKKDLGEILAHHLNPINKQYKLIRDDKQYLQSILKQGAEKASDQASSVMERVKNVVGFLSF
ncbi:MAG: tryptophan--tRNA ligase [Rickettsiaceae bacterium]|nr:tryptophan--tRNA ligase [Rickettsiaceae bacterium]